MWWMGAQATARPGAAGEIRAGREYRRAAGTLLALVALAAVSACASGSGSARAGSTSVTLITSCPPAASSAPSDRLTNLACLALRGLVGRVTTTYDPQQQTAQVATTFVGTRVPRTDQQIAASQEAVKTVCFRAQRALWASGIALRQVTVTVQGPILDDFFDLITDWYGGTRVTARTAAGLDWQAAGADGAWASYDQVWLRNAYVPNQYYSASPASTPLVSLP